MKYLYIPAFLFGLLILSSPVHSQSLPEGLIRSQFRLLSWEGGIEEIYYFSNTKRINVVANPYNTGDQYKYTGPPDLIFYEEGVDAEGMAIDVPVAKVAGLERVKDPVILLIPVEDGLRAVAFPDDVEGFGAGDYRPINLMNETIACKIGDATIKLGKYDYDTVTPNLSEGAKSMPLAIAVESKESGTWKIVYSVGWSYKPDNRVRVFIYKTPSGKIRLRKIEQHRSRFE